MLGYKMKYLLYIFFSLSTILNEVDFHFIRKKTFIPEISLSHQAIHKCNLNMSFQVSVTKVLFTIIWVQIDKMDRQMDGQKSLKNYRYS